MGKELAMVERNDKGREVRRYFINANARLSLSLLPQSSRMLCALLLIWLKSPFISKPARYHCHQGKFCDRSSRRPAA
jgi:hypothetical protein